MAQKSSSRSSASKTTVRRIKATDDAPRAAKAPAKKAAPAAKKQPARQSKTKQELGYFKGAWHELKQVRWPTRSATWSLTAAVLVFTVIFVVLILLLDAGFNWSFNQILK